MKKLFIILFLFMGLSSYGQTVFTQTYVDRCTGDIKVVVANFTQGSATVAFYNKVKTFTYQQFLNGELQQWLNETYEWWNALSPCSTATTENQTAQQTAQTATAAAQSASTAASSVPVTPPTTDTSTTTPPPATDTTTSAPPTTDTNTTGGTTDATSSQSTTDNTSTSNETTSTNDTSSSDTSSSDTSQGDTTGDSSGGDEGGTSDSSGDGGETTSEESKTEETSSETESTEESSEEVKEESSEESSDEESKEESSEESDEESKEEDSEESDEESDEDSEESKEDEEESDEKEKKEMLPIQLRADMMGNQALLGNYDVVTSIGASQSSIYGDETYGATAMIWSNLRQFSLNGSYTKVRMEKFDITSINHENHKNPHIHYAKGKEVDSKDPLTPPTPQVAMVTSASLGYMNNFGNGTFVASLMKIKPMGKWGTAGLGFNMVNMFGEGKYQVSMVGYNLLYTNMMNLSPRIQYAPAFIWSQSPYMGRIGFEKNEWGKDGRFSPNQLKGTRIHGMVILSNSFTVQLTRRFSFNVGATFIKSTNKDIPLMKSFALGTKLPF